MQAESNRDEDLLFIRSSRLELKFDSRTQKKKIEKQYEGVNDQLERVSTAIELELLTLNSISVLINQHERR